MNKIASPQELQAELRRLLAYSQSPKPSREKLAAAMRGLADRVAGRDYAPVFIHDKVKGPDGKVEEGKNAWLPRWGKPSNANLKKVIEDYERKHPGETVVEAEVRAQNGDVLAKYHR